MPRAEYLIVAAGAFAAGLALGPVLSQLARRRMAAGGVAAAILGAALAWPPSLGFLSDALGQELLGLSLLGVDLVVAALVGIAAVFLPLAFGATLTGS